MAGGRFGFTHPRGRSYYEEQVLTPDKKHEGTDILVSEKAPPSPKDEIPNLKSQI
jgi:hypothetical protein